MNTQDDPPMLKLVISHPLFPQEVLDTTSGQPTGQYRVNLTPVLWGIRRPHPFVDGMKIVAMFYGNGGVEVFSEDGKGGMRDLIPLAMIRVAQESMSMGVFKEELAIAFAGGDDEEEEEEEDEDPPGAEEREPLPSQARDEQAPS